MPSRPSRSPLRAAAVPFLLAFASCVTTNLETGKVMPREGQKYTFDEVEKKAEQLHNGMSKLDVHLLLGSPAEKDESSGLWVYLPERYGVLIPARALRLEFQNNKLVEFGYRPIVLGTRL